MLGNNQAEEKAARQVSQAVCCVKRHNQELPPDCRLHPRFCHCRCPIWDGWIPPVFQVSNRARAGADNNGVGVTELPSSSPACDSVRTRAINDPSIQTSSRCRQQVPGGVLPPSKRSAVAVKAGCRSRPLSLVVCCPCCPPRSTTCRRPGDWEPGTCGRLCVTVGS
jgi:hypothetical protein